MVEKKKVKKAVKEDSDILERILLKICKKYMMILILLICVTSIILDAVITADAYILKDNQDDIYSRLNNIQSNISMVKDNQNIIYSKLYNIQYTPDLPNYDTCYVTGYELGNVNETTGQNIVYMQLACAGNVSSVPSLGITEVIVVNE